MIYSVSCVKQSGACAQLKGPQYVGYTSRPGKVRFSEHLGSATQQCQQDTQKPVGLDFSVVYLPIERVHTRDKFVFQARESFWIKQYNSVKIKSVNQIEAGLNLTP